MFAATGTQERGGNGYVLAAGHAPLLYRVSATTSLTLQLPAASAGNMLGSLLSVDDTARGPSGFATYVLLASATDNVIVNKTTGPLAIVGQGGAGYQVQVGGQARNLSAIAGPLTILNAGVEVADQKAAAAEVVGFAADRLTINGTSVFHLSNATRLRYNGPNLANTYNIDGTPGNDLTVNGGTAADTFNVAALAQSLDGLGQTVVDGGGGGDRLIVDDAKAKAGSAYGVTSSPFFGLPFAAIGRGTATIYGFELASVALTGSDLGGLYAVTAAQGGTAMTLRGGAGDDRFVMQKADAKGALTLDGGGGANTLDYSATKFQAQVVAQIAPAVLPGAAPLPPGLVAWYRGEGNATDFTGQHNGNPSGVAYTSGEVGQAFLFQGTGAVHVPVAPTWNLRT